MGQLPHLWRGGSSQLWGEVPIHVTLLCPLIFPELIHQGLIFLIYDLPSRAYPPGHILLSFLLLVIVDTKTFLGLCLLSCFCLSGDWIILQSWRGLKIMKHGLGGFPFRISLHFLNLPPKSDNILLLWITEYCLLLKDNIGRLSSLTGLLIIFLIIVTIYEAWYLKIEINFEICWHFHPFVQVLMLYICGLIVCCLVGGGVPGSCVSVCGRNYFKIWYGVR